MEYSVKLESFVGPLDLLLHLVRKNELDIFDIPIAQITDDYLRYIELVKELNLELNILSSKNNFMSTTK